MNHITLEQALELVHPWLGTWKPGPCGWGWLGAPPTLLCHAHNRTFPHDIPMPPATDELTMQVLRKLGELSKSGEIEDIDLSLCDGSFSAGIYVISETWYEARADDPREAIIIAAGKWLQSQRERSVVT